MIIVRQRNILQLTLLKRCLILPLCLTALTALTACDSILDESHADEVNSVSSATKQAMLEAEVEPKIGALNPELWPKREKSPAINGDIELRIKKILAKMSVEEKVGQIIQPELKNLTPVDVREYHIGSVLNGGGTTPNNDKYATVQDWAKLAESYYQASMDESDGKVAIPLILSLIHI